MPISKAIDVVATVGSPNWLNIAKAVSRIRSRVRRGGFGGIAIHTLGTSGFVPAQRLFQFAQRFLERLHAIPQFAGLARRALRALQSGAVELQSVPGEDRPEFARPPSQLRKRMAIGVLGQRAPVGVAEHVGEEDDFVVLGRLEQHNVSVREFLGIAPHADPHAQVDEGAEGLGENGDEAPVGQAYRLRAGALRLLGVVRKRGPVDVVAGIGWVAGEGLNGPGWPGSQPEALCGAVQTPCRTPSSYSEASVSGHEPAGV